MYDFSTFVVLAAYFMQNKSQLSCVRLFDVHYECCSFLPKF